MLSASMRQYFEALHGLEAVLPPSRVQNKAFLLDLYDSIEQEDQLTAPDLKHLKLLMAMADRVVFPRIEDTKTYAEAEAFLFQAYPKVSKRQTHWALEWAFLLMTRHGRMKGDLETIRLWLAVWRMAQTFKPIEQGFVSDLIRWMGKQGFSPTSMRDILGEYRKFRAWMDGHGIASLGRIGNIQLQQYLLERACGYQNASKQKILSSLYAVLSYFKITIDGSYTMPNYTVKAPRQVGVNVSANSEEINRLWQALEDKELPAMAGLMLSLIIGHGLPLKALPLLRMTDEQGRLVYTERLPCRMGKHKRFVSLDLSKTWTSYYWKEWTEKCSKKSSYLFSSRHGQRRNKPVSFDFCQNAVKASIKSILGSCITVNQLERGAIKALAAGCSVSKFMSKTEDLPLSKQGRLMYWLALQQHQDCF